MAAILAISNDVLACGPGGHGPQTEFFEGAAKFKKGAKSFMKYDGSITFSPVPHNRSHGMSDPSDANVSVTVID